MIYDLNNPLDEESFKVRANKLFMQTRNGRRSVVVLEEKSGRTLKQNSYLHVILAYFACQYGCSVEESKVDFFKELVNPDTFVMGEKSDKYTRKTKKVLRSTRDVSVEEMTKCIDKFRNWSAMVAGIYLPSADEKEKLNMCEIEIKRAERYIMP